MLPRIASGPNKGVVPDIFINPHGQPSRMTLNKIIEIRATKAAAIKGTFFNSTTFRRGISEGFNTEMYPGEFLIKKTLEDYGLDTSGKEEFEIPLTDGSMMPLSNKIFFGLCHYQALRHHVSDKIQMRARQGVKANTRQPVSGRSKEGGLRVGEMERDALISHGGSALLRERLCDVSDAYTLPICSVCGVIAITDHVNNVYSCGVCGPTANPKIGTIRIPYVVKLLLFYLNACGIHMTFQTKNALPDNGRMEENFLL
jgi:DNA-directed RNA polymerase beta subunit